MTSHRTTSTRRWRDAVDVRASLVVTLVLSALYLIWR